jgi:hypothetical protein
MMAEGPATIAEGPPTVPVRAYEQDRVVVNVIDDGVVPTAVREAERLLSVAKCRMCEEQVAWRLADIAGWACTRLFPDSAGSLVVALSDWPVGKGRRWMPVPAGRHRPVSSCRTFRGAARVVARYAWGGR